MSKTKAIILMAFVLALAAGAALGRLSSRATPRPPGGQSWLIAELDLTHDQQQKMNAIWTDMMQNQGRQFGERMRALQQEREAAFANLLTDAQKQEYTQINEQFAQRSREMWKQIDEQFSAVAEKTRLILNETQRPKFDALVKKFRAEGPGFNWAMGPGGRGRGPGIGPPTRPGQ